MLGLPLGLPKNIFDSINKNINIANIFMNILDIYNDKWKLIIKCTKAIKLTIKGKELELK